MSVGVYIRFLWIIKVWQMWSNREIWYVDIKFVLKQYDIDLERSEVTLEFLFPKSQYPTSLHVTWSHVDKFKTLQCVGLKKKMWN